MNRSFRLLLAVLALAASGLRAELWDGLPGDTPGWKTHPRLGLLYSESTGDGWFFHEEHGWLYGVDGGEGRAWFFAPGAGWLWVDFTRYPHVFFSARSTPAYLRHESGLSWLYLFRQQTWRLLNQAGQAPAPDNMAAILKSTRDFNGVPGMVGAVILNGEVVAEGFAGTTERNGQTPVGIDSRFHLGSITKSMTATLAAVLVEAGFLSWDSTLGTIFPEQQADMLDAWKGVTLAQLLSHYSGAPRDVDWWAYHDLPGDAAGDRLAILADITGAEPQSTPGTTYAYSNVGFALAGAMLEKATGQNWETLMKAYVFEPLGLDSAGFGAPDGANEPRGHTRQGEPVQPGPFADNPPALGPAGRVHMSIRDFAAYARLHLDGELGLQNRFLSTGTFRAIHQPWAENGEYGFGWGLADRSWAGGIALNHTGSNTYWYAVVWIAPEVDFAVVAATNDGRLAAFNAIDAIVVWAIQNYL